MTTTQALRAAAAQRSSQPSASGDTTPPPTAGPVVLSGSSASPSVGATTSTRRADGPSATNRSRKLDARRLKTKNRVSVRLEFTLPNADRIFVIVRGPSPSCQVAGYIPFRARKGKNKVAFSGRVHGRRLEPGIYLISLSPNRRFVPGSATEYVRVVSPRRSIPLAETARKPSCSDAVALPTESTAGVVLAGAQPSPPTPTVRPIPVQPAKATGRTGSKDNEEASGFGFIPDAGVLGAATDDVTEEPFLAVAVLTIIAALLIAMLALVSRFFRGSWNP